MGSLIPGIERIGEKINVYFATKLEKSDRGELSKRLDGVVDWGFPAQNAPTFGF